MNILFCSSEVVPFAKTGGLADVAGTLPPALETLGVKIKVVMPRYKTIDAKKYALQPVDKQTSMARLGKNVEVYFVENQRYFGREGLYQKKGQDYPDNLERFAYYCTQALNLAKKIKFKPDIIHCNDWQTALIPVYVKIRRTTDPFYKNTKTVFTIHNLGYQGLFPREQFVFTGLDNTFFSVKGLEFFGKVNLLKGGLLFSDKITTVSSTYAREIQSAEFGCGLDGVLNERKKDVEGIVNGINYEEWDPRKNKALAKNYSAQTIEDKYDNKTQLQQLGKLPPDKKIPLLGMITRLADQKGLDIFAHIVDALLQMPLQFVLLGTGDSRYHILFENVKRKYKNASIYLKFDPVLAYKIYAGSDLFLMPSYYEPCGLGQLISLAFGTIPLVRRTGGLADTVVDFDPFHKKGNGFVFDRYESGALLEAVKRALCVYNDSSLWRSLMLRAMASNFSWEESAKLYLKLYEKVMSNA